MDLYLYDQRPFPVDDHQARLTAEMLAGRTDQLLALFQSLRRFVDPVVSRQVAGLKRYPKGCCQEITEAVLNRLTHQLLSADTEPGSALERLQEFCRRGGRIRMVWGALRGVYFQNALQIGGLYIDVSNDTVVLTKPPVEILPLAEAGLATIETLADFCAIARPYWEVEIFANTVFPHLAPTCPLLMLRRDGRPSLGPMAEPMLALAVADRLREYRAWIETGPRPPGAMVDAIAAQCRGRTGFLATRSRAASLKAIDAAVSSGRYADYPRIVETGFEAATINGMLREDSAKGRLRA